MISNCVFPIYMIGVYFETWACPWTDDAKKSALAQIESPVTHVFLSFVKPDCSYKKSQGTWNGTGLDFSLDFQVVREAIQILKSKGIKVVLSVGGASYTNWPNVNTLSLAQLCYDLEADGWDLDYEPIAIFDKDVLINTIKVMKAYCVSGQLLSIAGFAGGCLDINDNLYMGTMKPVLKECASLLSFVNIMNYDAGKGWDYEKAYKAYVQFPVLVNWGLEVGPQGWGDAVLTEEDVRKFMTIKEKEDGWFIWAYFKTGKPNCKEVLKILSASTQPKPDLPKSQVVLCPNCHQGVIEITYKLKQ